MRPATGFRRRLAVGIFATGLIALAPVTASLEAGATASQPLGSVNITANATGLRMPLFSHAGEDVEAELPYSVSQLGAGGIGHAVTSVFWPGSTGANGGSTVGVLAPSLPAQLQPVLKLIAPFENYLNDPYKAEAPTIKGETTVSKSNPGLIMQALALANHVNASSAVGPSSLSGFGDDAGPLISATTNIVQNATNVVVDAKSAITDLSIGPLSIAAITSTSHAVVDATSATGQTTTQITGVKVAGIAVTIDQNGVELTSKGILPASLMSTLSKTVNSALKAAGIQIYLVPSTKQVHGSQIDLDSSDLVISLKKPGYRTALNDTGFVLQLGGTGITAVASPGYVAPAITSSPPVTSGATPPPVSVPPLNMPPIGTGVQTLPSTAPPPLLATNSLGLPSALSSWWVVGGILLALLAALALGFWPSRALAAGADCSLEEDS